MSQNLPPMRTFFLLSVFAVVTARAAEAPPPTTRQKLSSKIKEAISRLPVPKEETEPRADGDALSPAIVMKPVVVSESKIIREVASAIARKEQEEREERFSAIDGGTIFKIGRVQMGGWWTAGEGWTFLSFNKPVSQRQVDAAEAKLRDLKELADMAEVRTPVEKSFGTKIPTWRRTTSDR